MIRAKTAMLFQAAAHRGHRTAAFERTGFVEFERGEDLFQLSDQAWHRGLANNRTQILAAIFAYQLLLRHNHRRRAYHARIQWILAGL